MKRWSSKLERQHHFFFKNLKTHCFFNIFCVRWCPVEAWWRLPFTSPYSARTPKCKHGLGNEQNMTEKKRPQKNLCTHRTGSALSLMPLSSGYPFLRHVGTASPLGRPQNASKTPQKIPWRPLEPPRDPPGDAKATQETPRTHQETPKRPPMD